MYHYSEQVILELEERAREMRIDSIEMIYARFFGERFPETIPVHDESLQPEIGKGITLREGNDVTLVCAGSMVGRSLMAADRLAEKGIQARVLEIHTIKPLDVDLVCQAAVETGAVVTAEEHSVFGGLGGAVAEALGERYPTPLVRVGIAETFTRTAFTPELLMDAYGLAVDDVVAGAERVLSRKGSRA